MYAHNFVAVNSWYEVDKTAGKIALMILLLTNKSVQFLSVGITKDFCNIIPE